MYNTPAYTRCPKQEVLLTDNIRIILVSPTHPGNIGAVARAMKTMGLQKLYLVAPSRFPDAQATERAAQAVDVLDRAVIVDTLEEAIQDSTLVFGTSARERRYAWPTLDPRQAAEKAIKNSQENISFVFGREHAGLTNEELNLCHHQVYIPANPEYSSLNLAAAVQVMTYELRMASLAKNQQNGFAAADLPTVAELEFFYEHLETVLTKINFLKPRSGKVMLQLRRLFARSCIEKMELNILRGILTSIEKT